MRLVFWTPIFLGLAFGLVSACSPEVPDSGAGFGSEEEAIRARELELAGGPATIDRLAPPKALASETLTPANAPIPTVLPAQTTGSVASASSGSSEDIAAQTAAVLAASSTNSQPTYLPAASSAPASAPLSNAGISDENDFAAVSQRQTIESDAARIASNKSQYQVITPTALPARVDASQPNIVNYALSTSHPRGTRMYSRSGINLQGKAERKCRAFASPDLAQMEFLSKGGPERDRAGLDPDGDGYACNWDPRPFRRAVSN